MTRPKGTVAPASAQTAQIRRWLRRCAHGIERFNKSSRDEVLDAYDPIERYATLRNSC
jgi:hypothetical protein